MPSNYTGDPAAADAPDAAPTPENFPIVESPNDGETLNVASILQRAKAIANHIAFLKKPIARASQWAENLRTYRDPRGNRRFKLDHFALPHGAYYEWTEAWTPSNTFALGGGPVNAELGRWNAYLPDTASFSNSWPPGVVANQNNSNTSRALRIEVDGGAVGRTAEYVLSDFAVTSCFTNDALMRLSADVTPLTVINMNWVAGFTTSSERCNAIAHGVYFIKPDGGANWICRTVNGGGPTNVDSGVTGSGGLKRSLEIYLVGSSLDDASTARALFFIDGALVANMTATLPINVTPNPMKPVFGGFVSTGAVATPRLLVGTTKYMQITATPTL